MEKPSFKLVGAPCGHHGQYTFYKALRLTGKSERIVAIGDFFFVRIWQDSELVSIGELQLLWTDRVSDQTLVSLRLYFLPENTPDGRSIHGEDEVLAINEKVVVRAEDLLSWVCPGHDWTYGLRAVWRGACAPPADARRTAPLHHTKLDFSDVEREKSAIAVDVDSPGVVVFSYPRYCRYRALISRLEGIQADWLRDSLVAALGGYAAPTKNTRILYCKDTFEYPELEGHEFVCNHLAPRLKGRPRGRRRRAPRDQSPDRSPDERSSEDERVAPRDVGTLPPRRLSLRNGLEKRPEAEPERGAASAEDRAFLRLLRHFYKDSDVSFSQAMSLKHLSLRALYLGVTSRGGYEAVCRHKLWRALFAEHHTFTRRHYERYLLPFENHERRNGVRPNGITEATGTIHVCESPPRPPHSPTRPPHSPTRPLHSPTRPLHSPPGGKHSPSGPKSPGVQELPPGVQHSPPAPPRTPVHKHRDSETGEVKEDMAVTSKPAEELNREFLDSLPKEEQPLKITVKPVEKLIESDRGAPRERGEREGPRGEYAGKVRDPSEVIYPRGPATPAAPPAPLNGHAHGHTLPEQSVRPLGAGRSSLRAVRVKPARAAPHAAPAAAAASTHAAPAPGAAPTPPPVTNFGIHHPPPHHNSDDEIVEVPYKPDTPEIIDLDEYPESPQAVKKKKLDILKERGLEVTPLPAPAWPAPVLAPPMIPPNPMLMPAMQHQLMSNAQLFQMYNIIPHYNGMQPPKVIQATPLYGTNSPEKTVYGNPKDPFMPPPHVLHGAPIKPAKSVQQPSAAPKDILDLTCKLSTKPAVEIVRVPTAPSPSKNTAQNLTKNYSIVDGKAVVGSNLEITLVNKAQPPSPVKKQTPQKRSSNGKFTKTPTPPKEYPKPYKKNPIIVPNYQVNREDSPTGSNSSQNSQKAQIAPVPPQMDPPKGPSFLDPSKGPSFLDPYMALYNLAGQMDPRQLAAYREIMANPFRYSGLLNMGVGNPTTKN